MSGFFIPLAFNCPTCQFRSPFDEREREIMRNDPYMLIVSLCFDCLRIYLFNRQEGVWFEPSLTDIPEEYTLLYQRARAEIIRARAARN
jgi:hypothetical protein